LLFLVLTAVLNGFAYVRSYIDDTAYHIPIAVEIARHQNPYYVDVDSAFTSFWFPAGAETITAAIVSVVPNINTTNLSGAIFFILFLLLTYQFAGIWTNNLRVRLLCVVITSLTPILLAQTSAFYVDIHFNFFVYLSLYFYCLSLKSKNVNYCYLGMSSAILSASIKYHGLLVGTILLFVGVYCTLVNKKISLRWWVIAILVACTVFTSGWYIRNWILKGNPIYPLALPSAVQTMLAVSGTPYHGMDFPNLSPQTQWPYPLIPKTLSKYKFQPDMTNNAFGIVFPVSLTMLFVVVTQLKKMSKVRQQMVVLLLLSTSTILVGLPFGFSVPRYVLFVPAIGALWPSILMACTSRKRLTFRLVYVAILILSITYIQANLINQNSGRNTIQNAIKLLQEHQRSDIVYFDFLERGNLKIGYLGGKFAYVASLYDEKLTNQLIQIHYRDYLLDKGTEFGNPSELVTYIQSLDLDYICIFDDTAPGAEILHANFPEKTFFADRFE